MKLALSLCDMAPKPWRRRVEGDAEVRHWLGSNAAASWGARKGSALVAEARVITTHDLDTGALLRLHVYVAGPGPEEGRYYGEHFDRATLVLVGGWASALGLDPGVVAWDVPLVDGAAHRPGVFAESRPWGQWREIVKV